MKKPPPSEASGHECLYPCPTWPSPVARPVVFPLRAARALLGKEYKFREPQPFQKAQVPLAKPLEAMRSVLGALAFWATAVLAVDLDLAPSSCTLKAAGAGKDDAPGFLAAVKHCSTTVIPVGTTLNISTKMDLTGFANKHIVRSF